MNNKKFLKSMRNYFLGFIGKSRSNFKSYTQKTIKFITEKKEWSIFMDGKYISKNINQSISKNIIELSNKPYLFSNKIIHFGSQYMWTDWLDYLPKSNLYIATFYHGKLSDNKYSFDHINKFIENAYKLEKIVTSSSLVEQRLLNWGIPKRKLFKIPIGVDTKIFTPPTKNQKSRIRRDFKIDSKELVIGSFQKDGIGWNEGNEPKMIKGPDIFIEAVTKLAKNYSVTILLTGPSRGYIKSELSKRNIKYIHYYFNSIEEIALCYKALDLYLVTSREEGGPKGIIESMSSGVPIVSTNVGMAKDFINSGENGYIAKMNGVDIAEKASTLINRKDLNEVIKKAKKISEKADWKIVAEQYWEKIYKPLLETQ